MEAIDELEMFREWHILKRDKERRNLEKYCSHDEFIEQMHNKHVVNTVVKIRTG